MKYPRCFDSDSSRGWAISGRYDSALDVTFFAGNACKMGSSRTILIMVVATALSISCSRGRLDRNALDDEPGFNCRSGASATYAPWGPDGLSKSCQEADGKRRGSFFAAERGQVVFRAVYAENGMISWEWLNDHGDVVRRGSGNPLPRTHREEPSE